MTTTELTPASAQGRSSSQTKHGVLPLRYEVDPTWPKTLPEGWTLGRVGGLSITARDEIVICHRQDLTEEELETSFPAPMVVVFDTDGNVVKSWGDQKDLPITPERLNTDYQRNIWIPGQRDGQIHKYDWEGNLLLKIGDRGVFDSHDGTIKGYPLNSAKDRFFKPTAVAVDTTTTTFTSPTAMAIGASWCSTRTASISASGVARRPRRRPTPAPVASSPTLSTTS